MKRACDEPVNHFVDLEAREGDSDEEGEDEDDDMDYGTST